jgi:hypothetical protein
MRWSWNEKEETVHEKENEGEKVKSVVVIVDGE